MVIAEHALLDGLTPDQRRAACADTRRLLLVAGAGSGKTEVMSRRVGWWLFAHGVPRDRVVAFTFTDAAAEELKFRIRRQLQHVSPADTDMTLGGMFIGTIHAFCLRLLRDLKPDDYSSFEVLDEAARFVLVDRAFRRILALDEFQSALQHQRAPAGRELGSVPDRFATIEHFLRAYDLLNEYGLLTVALRSPVAPVRADDESGWCRGAVLRTDVGSSDCARTFAVAAARYYAYLRCRRFLDFSTVQAELLQLLEQDPALLARARALYTHVVLDEAQDINPVQERIVRLLVGDTGHLTAVGDHRQAIYAWRGGRVAIMSALAAEFDRADDGDVLDLTDNFRSTPRIVELANRWAATITPPGTMRMPSMKHGRADRHDYHAGHVVAASLPGRDREAEWIATAVAGLVSADGSGARHDDREGDRGLGYSDVAVLVRSATAARAYMSALQQRGIPAVFRAGPDLFSQPEVLLVAGALALAAGLNDLGALSGSGNGLGRRIAEALGCGSDTEGIIAAACRRLREDGLPLHADTRSRLVKVAVLIRARLTGAAPPAEPLLAKLRGQALARWLRSRETSQSVIPGQILHFLLAELDIGQWEGVPGRGTAAMFHLGQFSTLILRLETPGWTSVAEFPFRLRALYWWAAQNSRLDPAPLLTGPDAVTISTIHGAKGLEFPAVFLADIVENRFPNGYATRPPLLPFDGPILERLHPEDLVDNHNLDGERRLMYVALTRAERYLALTHGGKPSAFFAQLQPLVESGRGALPESAPAHLIAPHRIRDDARLVTSFSDLRYYLECPHDYYLRRVLGFTHITGPELGYGEGVHNLLRCIHSAPRPWAALAAAPAELTAHLEELIDRGLFLLRQAVGEPARLLRRKAVRIVGQYVRDYSEELSTLRFEPERPFETLLEEENVLISGAIDLVRMDEPPRVTIIDYKSGDGDSALGAQLDADELRLQVSLYSFAARRELEYEPERGLIRYLGAEDPARRELAFELDDSAIDAARRTVLDAARAIRRRAFHSGPVRAPRDPRQADRCGECDFLHICGLPVAYAARQRALAAGVNADPAEFVG